MDPRVRTHAELLVDHCTDVTADDNVLIRAPTPAEELVVALYEVLGERGARPTTHWRNPRTGRAYARAMDDDDFRTRDHELAAMKETDVVILVGGATNTAETSDVDPTKATASSRARQPILEERLDTRWVITQHPTAAAAQQAEMSTAAWCDFVYDAVNRDWDQQREFQQQLADLLDSADEVRLVSGETTDLRLDVDGMRAGNDDAEYNLPGGEVYTSPVPDGVEGEVTFDLPLRRNGRDIEDARLVFEDGVVVDYAARRGEEVLASVLDTDDGARRLGELGIGMNRGIDRITHTLLFDEKMGDTVHLALGNALEECVPDNHAFNRSAAHVDMLVDMSHDARIEFDGDVVQRNGVFRFEDGFEE
ncbi:aminopeptidase [Halogranum rubrum]|uniref:Aminopeptidase n=1 Tax=Halogranum rubrum TaxID=553466 RepID=A0A1I4HDI8_9EURY|nr:aminopeptidase [Halogranum rubrum]SFL40388.1 aminopeptidase [Halogranum rubrum]